MFFFKTKEVIKSLSTQFYKIFEFIVRQTDFVTGKFPVNARVPQRYVFEVILHVCTS